jgi:hypothetical protein
MRCNPKCDDFLGSALKIEDKDLSQESEEQTIRL